MKKKHKKRSLYIPSKVDLEELILSNYTEYYLTHHKDKYAYVLTKIIEGPIFGNVKWNGLTKLNATILQGMLGGDYYKDVIRDLIEWEVIVTDNHFKQGEFSKGYGISGKYQSKAVEIWASKDTFEEKLMHKQLVNNNKPANYILSQLKNIQIKHEDALEYIEEKYLATIALIDSINSEEVYGEFKKLVKSLNGTDIYIIKNEHEWDLSLLNDKVVLKNVMINKYNSDWAAIHNIKNRNFCFSVDPNTGRVYTFITSLSKSLRQFLYHRKFPDQRLVNIDIKNSQPFIFCSLLKEYYKQLIPQDVKQFIDLCSDGELYDYLLKQFGLGYTRSEIKIMLFASIFYCKNHWSDRNDFAKVFRRLFPNVYKVIRHHKTDSHKKLSYLMQKAEADLMVQKAVKSLQRNSIFVSTIHDSIICLKSDIEKVKEAITYYFDKEYDLKPTLDQEYYGNYINYNMAA